MIAIYGFKFSEYKYGVHIFIIIQKAGHFMYILSASRWNCLEKQSVYIARYTF